MGFGILFIGYFLILNLTYYGLTDVIAATVMLLGLYNLSGFNKYFKWAFTATLVFLVFSLGEFGVAIYEFLITKIDAPVMISIMSAIRSIIIGAMSGLILKALSAIATEVDLPKIAKKCEAQIIATSVIYALWVILELPLTFINPYALAIASLITLLSTMVIIILNLASIYSCYMKICMPGEEMLKDKPSRFAFVNEYRARKAEEAAIETQKRLDALKKKREKAGKKK